MANHPRVERIVWGRNEERKEMCVSHIGRWKNQCTITWKGKINIVHESLWLRGMNMFFKKKKIPPNGTVFFAGLVAKLCQNLISGNFPLDLAPINGLGCRRKAWMTVVWNVWMLKSDIVPFSFSQAFGLAVFVLGFPVRPCFFSRYRLELLRSSFFKSNMHLFIWPCQS